MKMKSRFTKVAVASGLIVASGAAVLGITGFASAQVAQRNVSAITVAQPNDDSTTAGAAAGSSTAVEGSTAAAGSTAVDGSTSAASAPDDDGRHGGPHKGAEAVAKALGITVAELKTELTSGKSISNIAKAKNISIGTVTAAMVADFKAHLDEEVASGEHTQVEADAKLVAFTARVGAIVDEVGGPRGSQDGKGGHGEGHGRGGFATEALVKVLNLTTTELHTQLRSGKSIAGVATAQKVDIADVKAVLISDFKAHLAQEVTSGEHTQAEADAKLAEFTTNLDTMVTRVGPPKGEDGPGKGRGHEDNDDEDEDGGREHNDDRPAGRPSTQNSATNTSTRA